MVETTIALVLLFTLNILMIFSTAPSSVVKQTVSWLIGLVCFWWGRQISHRLNTQLKLIIFTSSCALLLLPILSGLSIRGSNRWLSFGPASLQPTEIVRPWLLLLIANTSHPEIIILPTLITAAQPDLSSALSILLLSLPSIFFYKHLQKVALLGSILLMLISPLVWKFGIKQYQKDRILTFLSPSSDPKGKGYNVIQSQIAIGSGGFFGKGFRQGTQIQLKFLPEKHTDFIFASLSEELGLLGVGLLFLAYYLLLNSILKKTLSSSTQEQQIFGWGLLIYLWSQIIANIGMNLGLLPVSGLPLPFISLGGSAIMALLLSLGILHSN